jgi:hypothetical protein
MWYKLQFGITVLMGFLLILAFVGELFLYLSHKGILSGDSSIISFFVVLLVPLSVVILACFIFSSGLILSSVGKYLFSGQLSEPSKRLFFVHSIYELSYLLFFLFIVFLKADSPVKWQ